MGRLQRRRRLPHPVRLPEGQGAALLQGFISAGYLPGATDATNPWIQLFKKINEQFNGNAPFDGNIVYGMSVGYLFVQALQKAGKNLTREGLIAAVEKGGFTGPGLVPLLYSTTSHAGYGGVQLSKVDKGVQAFFGPVYTTDAGDGASRPSTPARRSRRR